MKPDLSYKIIQKTEKYIEKYDMIGHGDCVVVGLSGGADSVCLFLILNKLQKKLGFELHALHVNHGIRGLSSKRDEDFSKALCEKNNVPYTAYYANVPQVAKDTGLTLEEAGRNVRYALFNKYAKELYCEEKKEIKIAVAHHKNDQAETVLFNMVRGSGLKGIGGMSPVSKRTIGGEEADNNFNVNVIRPLLCLTRKEIEEFLAEEEEGFCIDETNEDNDYSRNQIRNNVIPNLNEIQPRTVEHISLMAEEARELVEYMDGEVLKLFKTAVVENREENILSYRIDTKSVKDESKIIVRQLIIYVLRQLIDNYKDITRTHIEDIYGLFDKGRGKYVTLPYNLIALKEKGYVEIKEQA
ncbi:MAG: tRNA lysidine(34) synthetase TilS [Lachnospiraceae bacterium]|nr:tRNA lysidine(34) synthetase TilS [Lachnospiraceae bacterium]